MEKMTVEELRELANDLIRIIKRRDKKTKTLVKQYREIVQRVRELGAIK